MSARVYFVVSMLCYSVLTDRKQVLDLGSQACPYTKFCHTDAWKTKPNNTRHVPCCLPCSCDNDCWELDNCCPDKDSIDVTRLIIAPCIDSYLKWRPKDIGRDEGFYRVIDTCPISEDTRPRNRETKCSGQNKTTLQDFIWVSDKTGKIYQNIHCAKCHGIKEPITWQLQTTCFDIMTAKFHNIMEALLPEYCNIINILPEELHRITDRYKCNNPKELAYTSCNETGLMTSYDPALEIACKQSTWPYILGFQLTKNVFCVICNGELRNNSAQSDGLCSLIDGKKIDTTYTFLLDYTILPAAMNKEESNCGLDETFDEFMGLCRKLWCPIGTAPFYGRCKQLVSKMDGYVVNVQFYLDIVWNHTSLFQLYENDTIIWSLIYAQFIDLADLNSTCEVCKNIINVAENSTSDLILVVTFRFNSECDYGLALAKVADMRGKLIEIHINRTDVLTLLVQSDKQPSTVYNWKSLQTVLFNNSNKCGASHTLSFDDITCPRLELNYTEIEMFSHTENKKKDIFASFFMSNGAEQNVTRVSVCLDKYMSVMSINRATRSNGKMSVQMLLSQFFVLIVIKVYPNK